MLSGNVTIPQLVDKVIPAVVSIDVKSNGNEDEGTGMIITSDGEVITNNHVIELYSRGRRTPAPSPSPSTGRPRRCPPPWSATTRPRTWRCSRSTTRRTCPPSPSANSSKAVVGDAVVAIGNALGLAAGTPTVTQGIVSALGPLGDRRRIRARRPRPCRT